MKKHECRFDVLDENGNKIGEKVIKTVEPGRYLNDWFERPKGTADAVPLNGAIGVKEHSGSGKVANGALGYLRVNGNDPQQSSLACFLSSLYWDGHGTSITPDLFDKIMVVVAVRKAIKPTWLNDRDQFQIPNVKPFLQAEKKDDPSVLPNAETTGEVNQVLADWQDFTSACAVFNLFSGHNQTSEFTADYKGKKWPIKNAFFPFGQALVKKHGPQTAKFQRLIPKEDTFVHKWLNGRTLIKEAAAVLEAGEVYYRLFFQNYQNVRLARWKIEGANPGWYQIRNAMKEAKVGEPEYLRVTDAVKALQDWIVPKVYEYEFLQPEMMYDT